MEKLIKEYLESKIDMQLSTVKDGQPWACTVYYVYDSTPCYRGAKLNSVIIS